MSIIASTDKHTHIKSLLSTNSDFKIGGEVELAYVTALKIHF